MMLLNFFSNTPAAAETTSSSKLDKRAVSLVQSCIVHAPKKTRGKIRIDGLVCILVITC